MKLPIYCAVLLLLFASAGKPLQVNEKNVSSAPKPVNVKLTVNGTNSTLNQRIAGDMKTRLAALDNVTIVTAGSAGSYTITVHTFSFTCSGSNEYALSVMVARDTTGQDGSRFNAILGASFNQCTEANLVQLCTATVSNINDSYLK